MFTAQELELIIAVCVKSDPLQMWQPLLSIQRKAQQELGRQEEERKAARPEPEEGTEGVRE